MKIDNLNNLKPAKMQPVWCVINGEIVKSYRCLAGPKKGTVINNPQDYFKTDTLEIDNENA